MTAALEVAGLTVEIAGPTGPATVLADVSFTLAPGEVLGVGGESGAGKSLAGLAVLGLLEPPVRRVAGSVTLAGRRIETLPERSMRALRGRQIGAVFQDPLTSLNPLRTVGYQLVQTIRAHLPLSRAAAAQRALTLLEQVGIPAPKQRLGSFPHQLSGGMRQRVVLALAFACDPAVIIADEPVSALDVSIQAQVIALLKQMCRERGTAAMLITHDMGVIAEAADRVAVMYAGRIVETGAAARILQAPVHPYTAGLMASIPGLHRSPGPLPQIPGAMPRPGALPAGCAFHPRCPFCRDRCRDERPPLRAAGTDSVACWVATLPREAAYAA